ncbi:MAG TPA: NADH-quinone oxidoreductase subunit H [Candidatus Omnitrophota bacterium]|nr:NADH-quinone oxidoreductase subunit H [Candidatus Omnitrophota bacterium]
MGNALLEIIKMIATLALAPLVGGIITRIKNNLRMRKGPGVFQPYYDIIKLFAKEEVVSKESSWIFRFAPFVVAGSAMAAALFAPALVSAGDVLIVFFILSLGRFILSLAGLDTGSAFGGMGSSRDMFVSSLAEPGAFLAVFAVALSRGNTALIPAGDPFALKLSAIAAAAALLIVIIAETSRIPVDNQETHLELTMIHEAMTLEYSGRPLALIELAAYVKQLVLFLLLAFVLFPAGANPVGGTVTLAALAALTVVIAGIEVAVAKMRLFRAVDFLSFGLVLAILAAVAAALGA